MLGHTAEGVLGGIGWKDMCRVQGEGSRSLPDLFIVLSSPSPTRLSLCVTLVLVPSTV